MKTPDDLVNPDRVSGYDYVSKSTGPKPYQAKQNSGGTYDPRRPTFVGPRRHTGRESAQDFCDYINGKAARVVVHTGRSGRPDYMKVDGVMHMDLPGEAPSRPSRAPKKRRTSPERDFMLRMEPVMERLMRDGDMAEAKANSGRQACATAIGQLILRHDEMGGGRMFIVLPSDPADTVMNCLKKRGITLVTEQGGTA